MSRYDRFKLNNCAKIASEFEYNSWTVESRPQEHSRDGAMNLRKVFV